MICIACSLMLLAPLWMPASSSGSVSGPPANTSVQADTSAEEIVVAYLEAIGGADAVKAVVSKRVTYRVHMFGRDAYLMERTWTRPDSMRTGTPEATTYTLTAGDRSWRVTPEGRQELPAAVARSMSRQADIDGPLVDSADKGVTLTYSGMVTYDMSDLQGVTATFSDGVQWEYFFDARTGLLRRMTQPSFIMLNGEITEGPEMQFFFYDYRPAGRVSYPHFWIQSGDEHTHLFVVEDIQIED